MYFGYYHGRTLAPDHWSDEALYERVIEHDIAEQLRQSLENQTEPAFELALLLEGADKWQR